MCGGARQAVVSVDDDDRYSLNYTSMYISTYVTLQLQALLASKEHARRTFPSIRPDHDDLYLKIMVRPSVRFDLRLLFCCVLESDTTATSPRMRTHINTPEPTTQVAGESGHGKTSFINNLFLSYTAGQEVKPHDGTRTRVEDFLAKCVVKCVCESVYICFLLTLS